MKTVLKAVLSAKKEIGKVAKNAKNPHFKNVIIVYLMGDNGLAMRSADDRKLAYRCC